MNSVSAYERYAHDFIRDRSQTIGATVVQDWALQLPPETEILEIACGFGIPVTKALKRAGLKIWAIDSSKTLLHRFAQHFPDIPYQCSPFQTSHFFHRQFDAAICIGLMFLLEEDDQALLIKKVSNALNTKALFMFTAPIEEGRWQDATTGIDSLSLGLAGYTELLARYGFNIHAHITDEGQNHYYIAQKIS